MGRTNLSDDYIKNDYPLYPYKPNKILPLIAAGVFGIALVYHLFIAAKRKAFRYWWAFILGLAMEVAGFLFRRISADKMYGTKNTTPFAISMIAIVLAPAFFAASMYSSYGRLSRYIGPEFSPVRRATLIFVSTDFVSIAIQGAGSSMFTSTKSSMVKLGKTTLIVGFLIQLVAFGCFSIISVIYYRRVVRANIPTATFKKAFYALWVACCLIFIRSVFRALEFATGGHNSETGEQTGFLLTEESMFWIFETLMCMLAVLVLSIGHPSFYLPRDPHATLQSLPTSTWKQGY